MILSCFVKSSRLTGLLSYTSFIRLIHRSIVVTLFNTTSLIPKNTSSLLYRFNQCCTLFVYSGIHDICTHSLTIKLIFIVTINQDSMLKDLHCKHSINLINIYKINITIHKASKLPRQNKAIVGGQLFITKISKIEITAFMNRPLGK